MSLYYDTGIVQIHHGDALEVLRTLPDGIVQTTVTSPPYWGLRDYGVPGQLGLEATPEEHVAKMVEIFREVRRVTRDDGTLWLNYGDTYASAWPCQRRNVVGTGSLENGKREARPARMPDGLKEKDLCGIPWRVARALQEPYYPGRIKREIDRVWLAAAIDGEGCIFIHKRKEGQDNGQGYARKNDTYGAGLEVANCRRAFIDRCQEIVGLGTICHQDGHGRKQRIFRWSLRTNQCRDILREVYPYLVAKQHEARLAIGCPSSGPQASEAHESLKKLHNGYDATIDFPPPASLFEPGWYLRSDIIWSKSNPMPESVTDRPTKSHEYLFLMSKQPRYYWDAEAVREPHNSYLPMSHFSRRGNYPKKLDSSSRSTFPMNGPREYNPAGRNIRSVWTIPTQAYPEAHFATFPIKLVTPCVLAGSPPKCCGVCGTPWVRIVERTPTGATQKMPDGFATHDGDHGSIHKDGREAGESGVPVMRSETLGWRSGCEHQDDSGRSIVLDPFAGTGTVAYVARKHNRRSIGIELNADYLKMIDRRLAQETMPL